MEQWAYQHEYVRHTPNNEKENIMRTFSRQFLLIIVLVVILSVSAIVAWSTLTNSAHADKPKLTNPTLNSYEQEHPVPDPVLTKLAPEISMVNEAYPPGERAPLLAELLPWAVGSEIEEMDNSTVVLSAPKDNPAARQVINNDKDHSDRDSLSNKVRVVTNKGDVAVLAAHDWECKWISEYVSAREAQDNPRAKKAEKMVRKFPHLEAIKKFNPQLGKDHEAFIYPDIFTEDLQSARSWIANSCKE